MWDMWRHRLQPEELSDELLEKSPPDLGGVEKELLLDLLHRHRHIRLPGVGFELELQAQIR